jgi:hypothetical protein
MSALSAFAVCGSRRTSGHGGSPCGQESTSCALVAIAGGRADGLTSESEPGGGVWTRAVQIGVRHTTRLAEAYVAAAMRSPTVAGPLFRTARSQFPGFVSFMGFDQCGVSGPDT